MRNWDESEETGNLNCSVEEDHRDAKRVCDHLGIPLHEADFIDQYWNRVFSHFVAQYGKGLTPNPDLECNRSIKFDALLKHAQGLGAERVATGHYARLTPGHDGKHTPCCTVLTVNACKRWEVPGSPLDHVLEQQDNRLFGRLIDLNLLQLKTGRSQVCFTLVLNAMRG